MTEHRMYCLECNDQSDWYAPGSDQETYVREDWLDLYHADHIVKDVEDGERITLNVEVIGEFRVGQRIVSYEIEDEPRKFAIDHFEIEGGLGIGVVSRAGTFAFLDHIIPL